MRAQSRAIHREAKDEKLAKFVTTEDQEWGSAELGGLTVQECCLWQTEDLYAGLFKLPKGFQFPHHSHGKWVQIYVLAGKIRVDMDGQEPRSISAGEYYFVEPGEPHVETVEEDLHAYVVTAENRANLYSSFV